MYEKKQVKFELKAYDEEQGVFEGYGSVFNNIDDGNDLIEPGAFTKTINEWGPTGANRIKILALHKSEWLPIGKPLEIKEDAYGLYIKGKISATTMGNDVKTLLKDGVLTELSIGYDATQFEYDKSGVRHLKEVILYEVSPVTWAMNQAATINNYKSAKGGDNLETKELKIGTKAFTFSQIMTMEQLDDIRRNSFYALRESLESICCDANMNDVQKIAAMDTSLSQFHQTILEAYTQMLQLSAQINNQQNGLELVQKGIAAMGMETKAGAAINKVNLEKLKSIMDILKGMIPQETEPEEEDGCNQEQQNKSVEGFFNFIKDLKTEISTK